MNIAPNILIRSGCLSNCWNPILHGILGVGPRCARSVAYLQVLGVVVGPGQEHGCKQVARSHKHCVHFGDVHPNLLAAAGPVRFHYSMKGEKWITTLNG